MSTRNWNELRRPAMLKKKSCATLRSAPMHQRQEHGAALGVLPAMRAEIAVALDELIPGLRLLGGRERHAAAPR